jgi:glutathione synthase/RimK-type ligase-like ATP-grasp enzyme
MIVALLSIEQDVLKAKYVADDDLVIKPLRSLGHEAEFVVWRQAVDWRKYDGVVIRSTWDYQDHLPAFLRVLQEIDTRSRLANPLEILHWNSDKKIYLHDVEKRGGQIIPTIWDNSKIDDHLIQQWFEQFQTDELVIKPTVGANAQDASHLKLGAVDVNKLSKTFNRRSYMVQPFMRGIVEEGEFSLFYFNGDYSHAILKTPRVGDFRVQEEHGGEIKPIEPSAELLATGEKIVQCISPTPLYARVDFVRTEAGEFAVVELELIEPSMYLRMAKHAPQMFAEAIDRWLSRKQFPSQSKDELI